MFPTHHRYMDNNARGPIPLHPMYVRIYIQGSNPAHAGPSLNQPTTNN